MVLCLSEQKVKKSSKYLIMKNIKPFELLLMLCYIVPITCFCQDYKDYIDPTLDKYYDRNPT